MSATGGQSARREPTVSGRALMDLGRQLRAERARVQILTAALEDYADATWYEPSCIGYDPGVVSDGGERARVALTAARRVAESGPEAPGGAAPASGGDGASPEGSDAGKTGAAPCL